MPRGALFGVLAFLVAGGILATLEAALTALPSQTARSDRRFERWVTRKERLRATLWVALSVCRVGTGVYAFDLASRTFGSSVEGVLVLAVTFAGIVLVEVGARMLGRTNPEVLSVVGMNVLRPLEFLLTPVVAVIARLLPRLTGPTSDADATADEVRAFLEEGGPVAVEEGEALINAILEFRDTTAKEVMVPRTSVVSLDAETPLEAVGAIAKAEGHSRIPVYKGRTDNVVGILHVKDLLGYVTVPPPVGSTVESIIRTPVLFVPESQKVSRLLKEMRKKGLHLAMVVDEFGGTSGIVTLEDILEEIVGEIRDEYDAPEDVQITKVDDLTFLADASVSIYDLGEALGRELPSQGDYESLGGFLTAQVGRVPETGAILRWDGLTFTVREADEKRVEKVEIRLDQQPTVA